MHGVSQNFLGRGSWCTKKAAKKIWATIGLSVIINLGLDVTSVNAQFARQEFHAIPTKDISEKDFLAGERGRPVTVAGALNLPSLGTKLPAVILFHAAGGMGGTNGIYDAWVPVLNKAGIATFAVDSFAGRGIVNIPADVGKVSAMGRTIDAFRALEVLAKHPSIDPKRIAVMGFSHGSKAAMYSNVVRFQKLYGSEGNSFAAHIAVYSICNVNYRGDEDVIAPLLMLHGTADDWLPIGHCQKYIERLSKVGKNARIIEYAGAHHAYDVPAYTPERKLANASSPRKCNLAEGDNGIIMNIATQQPFTPADTCREKGVTIGYNEAAAMKSHADVVAFLRDIFKLK